MTKINFNIKPYKNKPLLLFDHNGTWRSAYTGETFVYWHKNKGEELAFKILVFDVNHECLHEILDSFIDRETSNKLDSKIGLEIHVFLYNELFEEYKKTNTGLIYYNNGSTREEYK